MSGAAKLRADVLIARATVNRLRSYGPADQLRDAEARLARLQAQATR